jgi:hypothetical protein
MDFQLFLNNFILIICLLRCFIDWERKKQSCCSQLENEPALPVVSIGSGAVKREEKIKF